MRRLALAAFAFTVLAACRAASAKPDFSGTWRFDPARSSLQSPAPDSSVFVIEHREPRFHLSRIHYYDEESDTFSIELLTDGTEVEYNDSYSQLNGRAYWEGDVLVFTSELMMRGESGSNVVRYSLADTGRTFIADEYFVLGDVSHENRWVFEKR